MPTFVRNLYSMYWKKLSRKAIKQRIDEALSENANYRKGKVMGVPASYLDNELFYDDAPFLEDSPFLKTLVANPNHIGVHTLGEETEEIFKGTQKIEAELIELISTQIFKAKPNSTDGYIAPGGTEANIEAIWIYRNYFMQQFGAKNDEIALVYSQDSHYSMPKGANLLLLDTFPVKVDEETRNINIDDFDNQIQSALNSGKKYFIFILNMATTMFGSVDDIDAVLPVIKKHNLNYKIHVDAAFGGFIYPFTNTDNKLTFEREEISSFTLDGHKMLQAPYGTGIFLIRKGMMQYSMTKEAQYVMGKDYTLCGSRSGANAIVVWMILMIHGSNGWQAKMEQLIDKKDWVLEKLDKLGVEYYHNPCVNIVTIKSKYISPFLMKKYFLVPDTHDNQPNWHKFIVMSHVSQGVLDEFIMDFKAELQMKQ